MSLSVALPHPPWGMHGPAKAGVHLGSRGVVCSGGAGFLQLHQPHQVKTQRRKICPDVLLDKYYKSCLLKMNQKPVLGFVSMGLRVI